MSSRLPIAATLALACLATTTHAYLKLGFQTANAVVSLRWTRPIQYFVTSRNTDGVTAAQLQATMGRAFTTWTTVPRVTLTTTFTGFTGAEPFVADGMSVIGFQSGARNWWSGPGAGTGHMLCSHSSSGQSRTAAASWSRTCSKFRPRLSTQIDAIEGQATRVPVDLQGQGAA